MWCEQEGVLFQFLKDESKPIIVKAERILLNVNPIYRLFHTKENLNFICSLLRKEAGRCIYSGSSEMTRRKRQRTSQTSSHNADYKVAFSLSTCRVNFSQ